MFIALLCLCSTAGYRRYANQGETNMQKSLHAHRIFGIAALALLLGGPAHAQSATGTTAATKPAVSKGDQNLMQDIAHANLSEIEAGQLALKQSKNDQVKSFAQKMIDDHTLAQKELEQLAQAKGAILPTEPDIKHKAELKTLSALEGDKFDKMYLSQGGVSDHKSTHKMLLKAEKKAKDADLQAYLKKTLPVVDQHLSLAQESSAKKSSSSGSSGK
jgi:putative membrane protein